jgi:predicted metal-dependent hydrolase
MPIHIDRLVRTRRRTIALIVHPDGSLEIRAPLRMSGSDIRQFVESRAGWVAKQQRRLKAAAPPPPKQFVDGEKFLFLGQDYPLTIVSRQRPALKFDRRFLLAKSALLKAKPAFIRWYKAQALLVISERAGSYARKYGFAYQKIRISSARTRWGSCSSKGTLSFTFRLIMAPPEVVDYVVIHELVHLEVKNHSRDFWRRVAEITPEYKEHVRWLRKNGKFLTL